MLPQYDTFLCRHQQVPLVAHVMLRDRPGRARLLFSGSADRHDPRFHAVIGPCNRLLHWHELRHYKAEGYSVYDFGGCDLDKQSPSYPISQFKLSFGGEVVAEPMLYLARNPALRTGLRGCCAARRTLREQRWLKAWLMAVKAKSKLASLFR